MQFLEDIVRYPCYGDVEHTSCDMERAVQRSVRESGIIPRLRGRLIEDEETRERAELLRLQAKYS